MTRIPYCRDAELLPLHHGGIGIGYKQMAFSDLIEVRPGILVSYILVPRAGEKKKKKKTYRFGMLV